MTLISTLTITGTAGADVLAGTSPSAAFVINGLGGQDLIQGGSFNDRLYGGGGADEVFGGSGKDQLYGGAGSDTLSGDQGDDRLYGEAGNDTLHGSVDNDRLFGDAGNDLLDGGRGDDSLYGGAGNDGLFGGDQNDLVDGGNGNDDVSGDNGDDSILGGDGADSLFGGNGHDVLNGNRGFDVMSGGRGGDRFVFDAAGTSGDPERDVISDFSFNPEYPGGSDGYNSGRSPSRDDPPVGEPREDIIDLTAFNLASRSQVSVVNEGAVGGRPRQQHQDDLCRPAERWSRQQSEPCRGDHLRQHRAKRSPAQFRDR